MNKHSPGKVSWEEPIRKQGQYFAFSISLCFFKTNVSFHIIIHPINTIIHSVDKHDGVADTRLRIIDIKQIKS